VTKASESTILAGNLRAEEAEASGFSSFTGFKVRIQVFRT
jgi:hypothetical protein